MKSDADLAAFVRRDTDTIYHGAGTCKMGPATMPAAVVDPTLRVRGVEGLRVADASIMPEVVNAPTNAACVMIGEKAALDRALSAATSPSKPRAPSRRSRLVGRVAMSACA